MSTLVVHDQLLLRDIAYCILCTSAKSAHEAVFHGGPKMLPQAGMISVNPITIIGVHRIHDDFLWTVNLLETTGRTSDDRLPNTYWYVLGSPSSHSRRQQSVVTAASGRHNGGNLPDLFSLSYGV